MSLFGSLLGGSTRTVGSFNPPYTSSNILGTVTTPTNNFSRTVNEGYTSFPSIPPPESAAPSTADVIRDSIGAASATAKDQAAVSAAVATAGISASRVTAANINRIVGSIPSTSDQKTAIVESKESTPATRDRAGRVYDRASKVIANFTPVRVTAEGVKVSAPRADTPNRSILTKSNPTIPNALAQNAELVPEGVGFASMKSNSGVAIALAIVAALFLFGGK